MGEYVENEELVAKLKEKKEEIDRENAIKNLDDVEDAAEIANFQNSTIRRLCKVHRILRNQKIEFMIEMLEDRKANPMDEDAAIQTLDDVQIDDIKDLEREVLERLCLFHDIKTTK